MSQICVVCNKRKAWHLRNMACRHCSLLTEHEGTRAQYGLIEPRGRPADRYSVFVKKYNELAKQGLNQQEIGVKLGLSHQAIKNQVHILRKLGFIIEKTQGAKRHRKPVGEPIKLVAPRSNRITEHGGGKWGVAGCECEPCQNVRRQTQIQWRKDNPEKAARHRQRYRDKKKPDKPS